VCAAEPPARFADDLFARAEGNPFFTEQLVATALAGSVGEVLRPPSLLPERLAELLTARASGCGSGARAGLAAVARSGRGGGRDAGGGGGQALGSRGPRRRGAASQGGGGRGGRASVRVCRGSGAP